MFRAFILSTLLLLNLYAAKTNTSVQYLNWENGVSFLGFLEKNKIPLSLFYNLNSEDQELVAEINAGMSYQVLQDKEGKIRQILIPISDELQIHIYKDNDEKYKLNFTPISYQTRDAVLNIEVKRSITEDIFEHTGSMGLAMSFIDAFKSNDQVNVKKVQKGDRIVMIYTQKIRMGRNFGTPEVYSAAYESRGKLHTMYKFENKFYDKTGKHHDKFLLVRPLSSARVTSPFTLKRFHPILRRYRAHLGVDYGAPKGTPVRSAGDGRIKFVGYKNGFGKTVIISHAGGYETLYAHLNGYAKGIKSGQSIKQGKLIAYVGSSGMSTGPHLHFGLYKNKKPINPAGALKIVKSIFQGKNGKKFKADMAKYNKIIKDAIDNNTSVPKQESFENIVKF
ncbi:MAG: peptidoglycan DD-metalloendopeptidase family protein [Campylobacter sp.]|nr:peptidoglycan DD-metalloendopeptidase family protein [Campylobacter sp.]